MGTEASFWIPLYSERVSNDEVTAEIDEILPKIKEEDKFIKPGNWDKDHTISTNILDRTDTIKDFDMVKLSQLIERHIGKYINDCQPLSADPGNVNTIFRGDSWVNINNKGDSQEYHSHGTAYISGVYYHKVPVNGGDLLLKHPIPYIQQGHFPSSKVVTSKISIKPMSGTIVLFPSWLDHKVERNNSDEERVSFAFNYYKEVRPNE